MSKELTPVAELLWRAANEHLSDTAKHWEDARPSNGEDLYTCDAIGSASAASWRDHVEAMARELVDELGLSAYKDDQFSAFDEFDAGPVRQGARYAWLMFASMYAQELGI